MSAKHAARPVTRPTRRAIAGPGHGRTRDLIAAIACLGFFALWTLAVCTVDVQPVGPLGSEVGFATVNVAFHQLTGENLVLYVLTDWLSLVPVAFVLGFGLLGLSQLVTRRSLAKVDRNLLALGAFYAVMLAAYLGFEAFAINYRPVLIDGILEASYPSSTTLLVLCVMPTAIMQLNRRIKNAGPRKLAAFTLTVFTVFMVAARLLSGVHWPTDIIGGILLSAGLVLAYRAAA